MYTVSFLFSLCIRSVIRRAVTINLYAPGQTSEASRGRPGRIESLPFIPANVKSSGNNVSFWIVFRPRISALFQSYSFRQ